MTPPERAASEPPAGFPVSLTPEDFLVEEIPLGEPRGTGDHCIIEIEKAGISTPEAARRLARILGIPAEAIGYAGLKDSAATSRQRISVKGLHPSRAASLVVPGVRVLGADLHDRKMRRGGLKGNRFRIRLPSGGPSPGEVRRRLEAILRDGMPNAYGRQRFGRAGKSADLGRALLGRDAEAFVSHLLEGDAAGEPPPVREAREAARRGDLEEAARLFPRSLPAESAAARCLARGGSPEQAARRVPRRFRQIYVSALQSLLFNRVLSRRRATMNDPHHGDLAYIHAKGACFRVEDPEAERPRIRSFEVSISGPIFGTRMIRPGGMAREMEDEVLAEERLAPEDFRIGGGLTQKGARRPLRVPVEDLEVGEEEGRTVLRFALPRGAYATTLLEEIGLPAK